MLDDFKGDLELAEFNTDRNGSEQLYPAPTSDMPAKTKNAPDLSGRGHSQNMEHETRFDMAGRPSSWAEAKPPS
jgi:hypothetical protein